MEGKAGLLNVADHGVFLHYGNYQEQYEKKWENFLDAFKLGHQVIEVPQKPATIFSTNSAKNFESPPSDKGMGFQMEATGQSSTVKKEAVNTEKKEEVPESPRSPL